MIYTINEVQKICVITILNKLILYYVYLLRPRSNINFLQSPRDQSLDITFTGYALYDGTEYSVVKVGFRS